MPFGAIETTLNAADYQSVAIVLGRVRSQRALLALAGRGGESAARRRERGDAPCGAEGAAPGETRVAATPETVENMSHSACRSRSRRGRPGQQHRGRPVRGGRRRGRARAGGGAGGSGPGVRRADARCRAARHDPARRLLVCVSGAANDPALVQDLAAAGIDVAAMELLPRITRAQSDGRASAARRTFPATAP